LVVVSSRHAGGGEGGMIDPDSNQRTIQKAIVVANGVNKAILPEKPRFRGINDPVRLPRNSFDFG
jgi:hypothetical protein